jgi:hypothetical protein
VAQPFTVPGSILELHAQRAHLGVSQGHGAETQWFDTSGEDNHGTLTSFDFIEYGAATNLFQRSRLVGSSFSDYCQHVGTYHGTPVWTRVAEADGSYYEQCVYTLGAGDASGHNFAACSLSEAQLGTFAPGDSLSLAIEYQLSVSNARSCTQGRLSICNQAYVNWSDMVFTPQAAWTRCEENIASMDAGTTGCVWFITVDFLDTMVAGDTITFKWRRPIARKAATAGPYFSGESEGCSWSGTADASVSTHDAGWIPSGWTGSGTLADPHRLVFDGTSDYVALPDLSAAEDKSFTYEAWFSTAGTGLGTIVPLVFECTSGAEVPALALCALEDGRLSGFFASSGWSFTGVYGTPAVTDEALHHAAFVCDGSYLRLYQDGVQVGGDVAVPADAFTVNKTGIGSWAGHVGSFDLPVARIYPFALTPAQVAQNYAAGYLWPPDSNPGGPGVYSTGPYIKIGDLHIPVIA